MKYWIVVLATLSMSAHAKKCEETVRQNGSLKVGEQCETTSNTTYIGVLDGVKADQGARTWYAQPNDDDWKTQKEVAEICKARGMRIPTRYDFGNAFSERLHEVLFPLIRRRDIHTADISHIDNSWSFIYTVGFYRGSFMSASPETPHPIVCVIGGKPGPNEMYPSCDLKGSRNKPVGFACHTDSEEVFTRVERDGFDEAWIDSHDVVYSDRLGKGSPSEGQELCEKLGAHLPTKEEYESAFDRGIDQILPNSYGYFWTSSEVNARLFRGAYSVMAPVSYKGGIPDTLFSESHALEEDNSTAAYGIRCITKL
jgi:hypothetical protein